MSRLSSTSIRRSLLVALAAACAALTACAKTPPVPLLPEAAYGQPVQKNQGVQSIAHALSDARLVVRARYDIRAHVMSVKSYSDELADVAPFDFALAWGHAAAAPAQSSLQVWQSGRWYRYSAESATLSRQELLQLKNDMANVHMVATDGDVRSLLSRVRPGDSVRLKGYLVDIDHPEHGVHRTSLSRFDSGAGACEILLVTEVDVLASAD